MNAYARIVTRGTLTSVLLALQTVVVARDNSAAAIVVAFLVTRMVFGNWKIAAECRELPGASTLYSLGAAFGVWCGTILGHQLDARLPGILAGLGW